MAEEDEPRLAISVEMKVNLGNYESGSAFVSMNGLTARTAPEEMEALLANGQLAWDKVRTDLAAKVAEIRRIR